jgi:DNA-binding transcriptional LysR family regulator
VGQIIVGFAGGTTYNLMQLQKGFMQQFPNAEFILRRLGTTDQVHALHDKKIHIGLLYPPVGSNKLNMMTLARQQILAALPHTHPLAGVEGPIEVSALARESFIMPPRIAGPSYYDTLHHICYRAGFVPKIVLEVYELETIVSLVSEALGVSLVPSLFRHYQINGVVYKELTETTPVLETSLAWRSDEMTAIVLTFIQFVKEWKGSSDHIY